MDDFALILRALAFAAYKHRDQRRKDVDASPYINHPIALADVLVNTGGVRDVAVICAALLHDTVEDTECTVEELEQEFGAKIAGIVLEVTLDMGLTKPERKQQELEHGPHFSPEARLVKLADKICNLRDLSRSRPLNWSLERTQAYFDHAGQVAGFLRGSNAALEAALDEVLALRPSK